MEEENEIQKEYTIYKITCLTNGKVYVGATSKTAKERFRQHWYNCQQPELEHRLIYQDMNAFDKDAFVVEIIEAGLSPEEAALQEDYWIEKLRNDGYSVYNQQSGGGAIRLTDDQERKIVQLYDEGLSTCKIADIMKRSQTTIVNVLNRNAVEMRDERGGGGAVSLTEEQEKEIIQFYEEGLNIHEIADIMKRSNGTIWNVLNRNAVEMRDAGRPSKEVFCFETGVVYESVSEAARQLGLDQAHLSACCLGRCKSAGKLHFCFLKDKDTFVIQESKTDPTPKEVLCVETGIIYPSAAEAARQLGLNQPHISSCCLGQRRSTGGYHFKFPEDMDNKEATPNDRA